jgi:1,4-dihydroxy-6-naphthoate synthase
MPHTITVAHSPDSDDAFMFWALSKGKVDTEGVVYRHELADIETLNRRALAGELEVTAVSFHAYAFLCERYILLPHGASFGEGYGPVVVTPAGAPLTREQLAGRVVAIPGELTSAALALRLWQPEVRTAVVPFDRIGAEVLAGNFPAGVLIHEGQLTWADEGLALAGDLGKWWFDDHALPLPLGGNAIRRDLGPELIARVSRTLLASIEYGLAHREEGLRHAGSFSRGLDPAKTDRFVGMYVNKWTLEYGNRGKAAVQLLLDLAAEAKIIPAPVTAEWIDS